MSVVSFDELVVVFIDAFTEVISTSTGVKLDVISSSNESSLEDYNGVISLSGSKPGMLFISAGYDDSVILCSKMTGVLKEEITKDDIIDTLCEFANMTAGNTKLRLGNSEYMYTLSSPFFLEGKDISIITKKKVRVVSTVFGNDAVTIKMKLVY